MSNGLYDGVSSIALGSGLYRGVSGLWSGASGLITGWGGGGGGGLPTDGTPTLIMDFVLNNPDYDNTLNLDFTTQVYTAYAADNATTPYPVILKAWT